MMIKFELDIPLLTEDGIQMDYVFSRVKELTSSSMINELIMIEMLILLIDSFDRRVKDYRRGVLRIRNSLSSIYLSVAISIRMLITVTDG